MADRILVTTDDLEHAVRINAALEQSGFRTTLATSLDEARQAIRREPPPDCVVVTGGLHETRAAQLLTLARQDAGTVPLARERVDVAGLAAGVVEDLHPLAEAKGQTLRLEVDPGHP